MPLTSRPEASDLFPAVQQEIARLVALAEVRSAFAWFLSNEEQLTRWQLELARIPAPPFGEQARSEWLLEHFFELGLSDVHSDKVGNVFGIRPGAGNKYIALSAHVDTVFPAGTPLNIRQQETRLYGPGVSDNGAGVTAMLADSGIEFTDVPPRIIPILKVVLGEAGSGV